MKLRELFECCSTLAYIYSDTELRIENPESKYYFTGYRVRVYGTLFLEWRMYKVDAKGNVVDLVLSFTNLKDAEKDMKRKRVKPDSDGWHLEPICFKDLNIRLNNIKEVFQKIEEDKE